MTDRSPTALVQATLVAAATLAGCSRPTSLVVGLPSVLVDLDPHARNTVVAYEALSHVYEPLVALDRAMRPVPALAESWQNPDPLTWVFKLRDARFHDGSRLGAEDVAYSLRRLQGDERLEARAFVATVAEVSASGPDRLLLRTRAPNAHLASRLHFALVVQRGASAESLRSRANGTGPYRADPWAAGSPLLLRRNASYWGERPAIDTVTIETGVSTEQAVAAITTGRYGLAHFSAQPVADAAAKSGRYQVVLNENIFLRLLGFDVERERTPFVAGAPNPFRSREVREAVSLALDRSALAAAVSSTAAPAWQLVPRAIYGHDPRLPAAAPDPERARALLAAAGFPRGFDVILHRPGGYQRAAEAVAAQLSAVGIRAKVVSLPSDEFFARLGRRELSFWFSSAGCVSGEGLELLERALHSPEPGRGFGIENHGGYRNPELDQGIAATGAIFDVRLRQAAIAKLLRQALEDRPLIPLYHDKSPYFVERSYAYTPRADDYFRATDVRPASAR